MGVGDSLTIGHADLVWMDELASILRESGELIAARKLRQEILEGRQQTLGVAHRGTLAAVDDLAAVLEDLDEPDAARDLRRKYRGLARTAPAGIGAAMARCRQRAGAA